MGESKTNGFELKLSSNAADIAKELLTLAESAEVSEKKVTDLGKSLDELGKRKINITPKINFELDAKSAKVVEHAAKQIQGTIDKAFKKYKVSATLALPDTITSSSQKKKLNDLLTDANKLGYTGQALDAINLKYQEIIKTVAALNAENQSLKNSLSSMMNEQDIETYFNRVNKFYNTRKKLNDLNNELPVNLKLTTAYKSFGELAELPDFERYINRHKKMVADAIYINTGFVDSINQIVAAGKEVKTVDLSSIVSNIQITEFAKLLGKARQEISKYAVDTETALRKLKNLTTRYTHDKLSDQGAKDIAGYYTSYLKQGGTSQKKIENIIEDLSTYTIAPGQEGYSKVEHTKAQKVLAIQEAVKEGIIAQIAEQQKLNAEKEKTAELQKKIQDTKVVDTNTQKQIQNQEQLTNAVQKTIKVCKQEVKSIEDATAAIERQQKIAANAPIASVKTDNATIYQNTWNDVISANNLLLSKEDLTNAQAILGKAKASVKAYADAAITDFKRVSTYSLGNISKKLKQAKFNLPNNYILNQLGDVSQDDESWKYLVKLNEFQTQTVRNAQDQDGQWHVIFSKIFTDFKQLSSEIIKLDTAILKTQNDLNNLGKTKIGKFQDKTPLVAEITAKTQMRDALLTMAKNVGTDDAYAADYWQFVKDRQDNSAQIKRDLAIANSKQDAKIALEAANTAKKIADDAVKKIATADAKLASMKQTIKTIQAGYTSGKSMIPDEEVRNLLDTEATDIKSYMDNFIGKGLKQNDIFAIEDKINSLKQSVESFRLDPKLSLDKSKLISEIDGLLEKLKASKEPTGQFQLALEKLRKALNMPLEKSQFDGLKNTFNDLKTSIKNAEIFVKKTKETTKAINDYRDGLVKSGELTKAIDDEINKLQNQLGNIKTITGIEAVNNGLKELKANASTLPKTVAESFNVMLHKMYELTDALNKIKELQALQATDPTISYKSQITGAQKVARQLQDELSVMKPESFMQKNVRQISQVQIDEYQQLKEEARQTAEAIGSIGSNIGGFSGGNNPPGKIEQLKKALKDLYNEQLNLIKLNQNPQSLINDLNIQSSQQKILSLTDTVKTLKQEVSSSFGQNVAETIVGNVNSDYFSKFTANFDKTIVKLTGQINDFENKFGYDARVKTSVTSYLQPLLADLEAFKQEYSDIKNMVNSDGLLDTSQLETRKQTIAQNFANKANTIDMNITGLQYSALWADLEKLDSYAAKSDKIQAYADKIVHLKTALNDLLTQKINGNIADDDYNTKLGKIFQDIVHLKETKDLYKVQQDGTTNLGRTDLKDLDDLSASMMKYAESQHLVIDNNYQIDKNADTSKVTQYYRNQNKELVKLTGTLKENMGYVKQVSLGHTGLMGDWGVAFGGFAKQLASYYTGYQAFRRIIGQAREGLNVLKQYDAALTDMSYSMDVTEKDLDRLGSSAVTMAKDLSTSLEDTLGIYQIYANMNTSIQEIEDTAKPTAILSNLGGIDALQASDQIQGVLQQFNMIEEGGANAAEASMHVVDVFDNIASNVSIDYVKGMQTISEAVTATGSVAYDAGMSFEQLAAVTAKVAERTREDGGTIGNAIKTIVTRISKVGKMPAYADEVSNEELSKASEALNEIGIAVYNADGSFRELDVILTELRDKWDGLTDAQQANLSFQIAATRQTSKFKNILESWTEAMSIADAASVTSGNAEANQEKYEESVNGKLQKISTQWDAFWLSVYDSKATDFVLDFFIKLTGGIDNLAQSLGGGLTAATLFFNLFAIKGKFLKKGALSQPKTRLQTYIIIIKWAYYHKEYYIMA